MAIITPGKPVKAQDVLTISPNRAGGLTPAPNIGINAAPSFNPSTPAPIGAGAAPTLTLDQIINKYNSLAPQLQPITPIAPAVLGANLQNLPGPIQGMNPQYFDTRFQQAADRLASQFYGPGGTKEQTLDEIAKRGLIGSEAEQAILGQRVDNPYGQAMTDLNRELTAQQIQSDYQTQQFNTDTQLKSLELYSNLAKIDAANILERDAAQAEIQSKYMDLGSRLFSEQAQLVSQEKLASWEAELKAWESANELWMNRQKLAEEARQFDTQTLVTLIQTPGITPTEADVANEELRRRGTYGEGAKRESSFDTASNASNAPMTLDDKSVPADINRSEGSVYTDPVTGVKYKAYVAGTGPKQRRQRSEGSYYLDDKIYIWARQ